jgi:hypothetical protein
MTDDTSLRTAYEELIAARATVTGGRAACPSAEALFEVVERQGAEEARLVTMDHVMQCATCRQELDLLRAARAAARETAAGGPASASVAPITSARRFPVRTLAVAAGLVFVVGVGVIVRGGGDAPDEPRLRGGERQRLTLVPPVGTPDGGMLLRWRSVPNTLQYRVEIFDGAGRSVTSANVADTSFTLAPATLGAAQRDLRYVVTAVQANAAEVTSVTTPLNP